MCPTDPPFSFVCMIFIQFYVRGDSKCLYSRREMSWINAVLLIKLAFNEAEKECRSRKTSKVREQAISDVLFRMKAGICKDCDRGNVSTEVFFQAQVTRTVTQAGTNNWLKGTCWTKYCWGNRSGSSSLSSKLSLKGILRPFVDVDP